MKAVILAGGRGERLRPLTCSRPKPLVDFMDAAVLDAVVKMLRKNGIGDIILTCMQCSDSFEGFASRRGITVVKEPMPLGTAGAVKNCAEMLTDTFAVVSGDCISDMDIKKAVQVHEKLGAEATLLLIEPSTPTDFGVVSLDENGYVASFKEKPAWSGVDSPYCNSGIYVLEPSVLDIVKENTCADFSQDVFPALLEQGRRIAGVPDPGYWCDIGDGQKYRQAHFDALDGKCSLFRAGISKKAYIGRNVIITPPVYIADGAEIRGRSIIDSYTVIGRDCRITDSHIRASVLWQRVRADRAEITHSIICSDTVLEEGASVSAGCAVGEQCTVGRYARLLPGSRLWQGVTVQAECSVSRDVRAPAEVKKQSAEALGNTILSDGAFAGLFNAARCFAQNKNTVAVIPQSEGSAQAAAAAAACGALLAGSRVLFSSPGSMGQARFFVREYAAQGGIALCVRDGDISARFMDKHGLLLLPQQLKSITKQMNSDCPPFGQGGSVAFRQARGAYLGRLAVLAGRARGVGVALWGDAQAALFVQQAVSSAGIRAETALNGNGPEQLVKQGCIFGVSVAGDFTVRAVSDENGKKLSYEQLLSLRAVLCRHCGLPAVLSGDCSQAIRDTVQSGGDTVISQGNTADDAARALIGRCGLRSSGAEKAALLLTDAAAFVLALADCVTVLNKPVSSLVNGASGDCRLWVRCPDRLKGRVMQQVRAKSNSSQVKCVPDDSLAVIRVHANALSQEFARELAMDMQAVIDETVRHGQS